VTLQVWESLLTASVHDLHRENEWDKLSKMINYQTFKGLCAVYEAMKYFV